MREKMPKSAGAGLFMLFFIALGIYFNQGNSSDDDPEVAEETALGQSNSSPESILDEELSGAQEFYASSSTTTDEGAKLYSSLEIPRGGKTHGIRVEHTGFVLDYDTINHTPFWVAWELTSQETRGREKREDEEFLEDLEVPERHAVRPSTYSGTGYSRGHMCPAGDQKWSKDAMHDSFYMTNMCPQTIELNKTWWDMLERAERQWARQEGSVYIVCGPIFDGKQKSLRKKFYVGIPNRFFKVILSTKKGQEKALGFIYRNDASEQYMEETLCTIDQVEKVTGYDFFSNLPDDIENVVEAHSSLSDWGKLEPYQFK